MANLREVLLEEKKHRIASRQSRLGEDKQWRENAPPVGLAFSGGGIRSATFNLGLIQSFAQHRLLHFFDYLSTVSGGGYIGCWLLAWMHNQTDNQDQPQKATIGGAESEFGLKPYDPLTDNERPSVRFLRYYSRYLSPKRGLLSADPWTLVATYLRNTILNFVIFSAVLVLLLLIPRWITTVCSGVSADSYIHNIQGFGGFPVVGFVIGSMLAIICMWYLCRNLAHTPFSRQKVDGEFPWYTRSGWVQLTCVTTLVAACAFLSVVLHRALEYNAEHFGWGYLNSQTVDFKVKLFLAGSALYFLVFAIPVLISNLLILIKRKPHPLGDDGRLHKSSRISAVEPQSEQLQRHMTELVGWGLAAAGISGALLIGVAWIFEQLRHRPEATWLVVGLGTFLLVGILQITAAFHIGMMGRDLPDELREWLARFGAWTMIYNLVWLVAFSFVVYVPTAIEYAAQGHPLASGVTTVVWLVLVIGGVVAAKSSSTALGAPGEDARQNLFERTKRSVLTTLARTAPYLFISGVLGLFAFAIAHLPSMSLKAGPLIPAVQGLLGWLPALTLACLLAAWFFGRRVDVNEFSMHSLYRNRLVRCYLGASAKRRKPQPFTAFDSADDIPLTAFVAKPGEKGAPWPYPIINAALNVVRGKDELALQTRKAKSFIFSPLFCGYDLSKYEPTNSGLPVTPKPAVQPSKRIESEKGSGGTALARQASPWPEICDEPEDIFQAGSNLAEEPHSYGATANGRKSGAGITLGTAMAISGAAASPSMGYHTSPATSFLLSLFNIRLGEWIGNPKDPDAWARGTPRFGLYWLLSELFGNTTDESDFLYLSDGGHFENLGIYELVRRRCGVIVASDSAADPEWHFTHLANAIERCRTDFAVSITFKSGMELEDLIKDSYKRLGMNRSGLKWVRDHDRTPDGLKSLKYSLDILRPGQGRPALPLAIAEIDYGDGKGILIYIRPTLLEDLPPDVRQYARLHQSGTDKFPQQSTNNQFFDELQFESYRTLGTRTGDEVATVVERAVKYCLGC